MKFNLRIYLHGLATAATVCLGYLMRLFQFSILYSTQENEKITMGKPVTDNFFVQTYSSLAGGKGEFYINFLCIILVIRYFIYVP